LATLLLSSEAYPVRLEEYAALDASSCANCELSAVPLDACP
jgi:hypothetical protein